MQTCGGWTVWSGSHLSTACCRHRANKSRPTSNATVVVTTPSGSAQPPGLVLGLTGLQHPREMSTTQISVALGRSVNQMRDTLRRMEASGLITSRQPDGTGMVGRQPLIWTVHGDALAGKDVLSMGTWAAAGRPTRPRTAESGLDLLASGDEGPSGCDHRVGVSVSQRLGRGAAAKVG